MRIFFKVASKRPWFCLLAVCAVVLSTHAPGEERDLLPLLDRQQEEASQSLRLEQQSATLRDHNDRNAQEKFQQGILHEQQKRRALVSRPSTNRTDISRPGTASTNIRLQQFGREQSSKALQFKITR